MLSLPLRAYAFAHHSGAVEVSVHRDLSTMLTLWTELQNADPSAAMLVHVGFDRPEAESVLNVLAEVSGRVLLSEPARWTLPGTFAVSAAAVATVRFRDADLSIYLGKSGWGYSLDATEERSVDSGIIPEMDEGWLHSLREQQPLAFETVVELGIVTDAAYVERRGTLRADLRDEIDDFRFEVLRQTVDQTDPFALLQIAPEWLLCAAIEELVSFSVRVRNCMIKEGVASLGHLAQLTEAAVLAFDNFGQRSYATLAPSILEAAQMKGYHPSRARALPVRGRSGASAGVAEALDEVGSGSALGTQSLREGLYAALATLQPRDRIVIEARLGREGKPKKLEEIGELLGVTRERARQLEHRGFRALSAWSWSSELPVRIEGLLSTRKEPLFLDLLAAEDPWFAGFDNEIPFLGCLIQELNEGLCHVWPLDGRLIVTRVREADWHGVQRLTRVALEGQIPVKLTRADVRLFVEGSALSAHCPDLGTALFQSLADELQFARDPETEADVLIGVGRSVRAVVAAIMNESLEPLDLRTVAAHYTERMGEPASDISLRNALASAGAFPFSGRRYALERHLGLSNSLADEVVAALESVLLEGPAAKQWHCSELVSAVVEQRPDLAGVVDQYVANILLRRSAAVSYLGRLVWTLKGSGASSTRDRLDIADLTHTMLVRAGRPLTSGELKREISAVRGLNTIFLMFPSERVARLEPGVWGLVDRDFSLSPSGRDELYTELERLLGVRTKALHVSELRNALRGAGFPLPGLVNGDMILGLCQIDPRFRVGYGQLVGLASWLGMNRFTARGAIRHAATEQGEFLDSAHLYARVNSLTERQVERSIINVELKALGYTYDEQLGAWRQEGPAGDDFVAG